MPTFERPHHCHAYRCDRPVKPELLMCYPHWMMVPPDIRARVWEHYRPGQCDDMNPSREWLKAAQDAQEVVLKVERARCAQKHGPICECWKTGKKPAAVQGDLFA